MTPFPMRVSTRPDGLDVAEASYAGCPFRAASRHGATMALARLLVAAGAPDAPWQAVGADGRVRFVGPSLLRLAALTIEERDRGRMRIAPFIPFVDAPGAAATAAAAPAGAEHCPPARPAHGLALPQGTPHDRLPAPDAPPRRVAGGRA